MKFNRSYMKGAEFISRQAYLPFVDAVGIVLELFEPIKRELSDWYKAWVKSFVKKPKRAVKPFQLDIFCQFSFSNSIHQN